MALTRKFLAALGIEADKVDEIIEAHVETVNAIKKERDDLQEKADKADELAEEVKNLKNDASTDGKYKVKYEALKTEFNEYKEKQENAATFDAKTKAFVKLLKDAGIPEKRHDAIIRVSTDEINALELDDEGNAKDAEDVSKKIDEDWSDFKVTDGKSGVNVDNPPENNGGSTMTKEEIFAIKDTAERQAAMLENKSLFLN